MLSEYDGSDFTSGRSSAVLVRLLAAGAVALSLAACEPFFIFSGGELGGTEQAVPSSWGFAQETSTVQVETQPDDPYSVNVWGVGVGANFYVAAADPEDARWAQAIEANAQVRLRIAQNIYPLAATRVVDQDELERVVDAYVAKYDVQPDDNFVAEAWVYRLQAR